MPSAPLVLAAALLGLGTGSLLHVVLRRVLLGEAVATSPGGCPGPEHRERPREDVPGLPWLLLRGRFRTCAEPVAPRYPLLGAATAALFVGVVALEGLTWALPALLYLAAISVVLTLIDLDVHRLPDVIVLPSYPVCAALLAVASWNPGGEPAWSALGRAAVGGAGLLALYLAPTLAAPGGVGLGDVKLAGLLGLCLGWFGWGALAVGGIAAFVLGGLYAVGLLVTRRANSRSGIPFGPWMLAGAWLGIAVGERVPAWYPGLLTSSPGAV